jgi:predicted lipid-binding transport protein (Tim44 family)
VLKLEAELLEVREVGEQLEAVVMFDGVLREADDDQARQVREVWHFTKARDAKQPTWFLDGIQQLED